MGLHASHCIPLSLLHLFVGRMERPSADPSEVSSMPASCSLAENTLNISLWQPGFNSVPSSQGLVKWLKVTAMCHQKTSPSTSACLLLFQAKHTLSDYLSLFVLQATFCPVKEALCPCGYDHQSGTLTGQLPSFPQDYSSSSLALFIAWSFHLAARPLRRLRLWFTDWFQH